MIDNSLYSCGSGCVGKGPSALIFPGPIMLLRGPCICPTSFAPFVA